MCKKTFPGLSCIKSKTPGIKNSVDDLKLWRRSFVSIMWFCVRNDIRLFGNSFTRPNPGVPHQKTGDWIEWFDDSQPPDRTIDSRLICSFWVLKTIDCVELHSTWNVWIVHFYVRSLLSLTLGLSLLTPLECLYRKRLISEIGLFEIYSVFADSFFTIS